MGNRTGKHDRIIWVRIAVCVTAIALLLFIFLMENRKYLWSSEPLIYVSIGEEVITLWQNDEEYVLFLPSHAGTGEATLTGYSEKLIWRVEGTGEADWNKIEQKESLAALPVGETLICRRAKTSQEYKLTVLQSQNMPTVYIKTAEKELSDLRASKDCEDSASFLVINPAGEEEYYATVKSLHGRGNTTFTTYEKKSWSLEFKTPLDLFSMGSDERYVLLSNASDPTLLRNDLMRRLEETLNIPYAKAGTYVDLYMNGEYQGNYYLCAPVQVGSQRINITNQEPAYKESVQNALKSGSTVYEDGKKKALDIPQISQLPDADVTGGYLLEREYTERYQLEYYDTPSSFVTDGGECFMVRSPKNCSIEQIEYISDYVEQAEQAILSDDGRNPDTGKAWDEYLDAETFSKRYLAEEISKNIDAGVSSTFFYKDSDAVDGKIKMAPGWDYDMCLGNYLEWMEEISGNPEGLTKLSANGGSSVWFDKLYDKNEYYNLVVENYETLARPFLVERAPEIIAKQQGLMAQSITMNHMRWEQDLAGHAYHESVEGSMEILLDFLKRRVDYLDREWLTEDGI